MKQVKLINEIDSIIALLPTEQQATVILRYDGSGALKKLIGEARHKLEAIQEKLAKK